MYEFVNYLVQFIGVALFGKTLKNYVGKILLISKKSIKQVILTHNLFECTSS